VLTQIDPKIAAQPIRRRHVTLLACEGLGLPDLVDLNHYRTQLDTTFARFMSRSDAEGRPIGAPMMITGAGTKEWPFISILGSIMEEEVAPGANYFTGAIYYNAGRRFGDPKPSAKGITMATAVADQVYRNDKNGFAFNTPMMWNRDDTAHYIYPAYERELAIWDLIDAIKTLRKEPGS